MNKKGQVVMEIMVVISVLVIGMVLFGLFYLRGNSQTIAIRELVGTESLVQSPDYSEVKIPAKISCGNSICETGENCDNCPSDCVCQINCGNSVIDSGESCDSLNLNEKTCELLGHGSGNLTCNSDCTFNTSGCSTQPVCGNNIVEGTEQCDNANLNGYSCSSLGFNSGTLSCNSNCTFNTSACINLPVCGNGVIEGAEECDSANLNDNSCSSLGYDYGSLSCSADCSYNTTDCKFLPSNTCLNFDSGGWRRYNTTNPNWYTRGKMSTWPDPSAIWLCPDSTCTYITDYYFLYNSFLLLEETEVTISALGDDETKVWLWPDKDIANEILVIPKHIWINGWISDTLTLSPGTYSIVQLIYDTNQSATGAILSVKNENTNEIILNTALDSGWHYYRTMIQSENERFSSVNGCSRVYSNQLCGNEIIEGNEQCEGLNLGSYSDKTCSDINSSWDTGSLSCSPNYCQIDTSNCKKSIELILTPETGSIRRNRNFNNSVSVIGETGRDFDLTASVKLKNNLTGVYEPTNNCKYVTTGVYSSTFNFGSQIIPITKTYGFNCNTKGTYQFTFKSTLSNGTYSEDSSVWTINN